MKAIVCPQCGGLIDDVSERRTIAKCGYCGARVLIEQAARAQPTPLPPPARDTLHIPLEGYKPFDEYEPASDPDPGEQFYPGESNNRVAGIVGVVAGGAVIIFVLVMMGSIASKNSTPKQGFTSPAPFRTATPFQPLNVQPVTNDDAISLPKPVIPKNLKITKRIDVEVYVSVDEQGNVYDAMANTDVDALEKITVAAARKAKFRPSTTNQRTSGLLVYTIGPR